MPKAQVLVTLTAEALIEVPEGADVETFCREQLSLDWGPVRVGQVLQPPTILVEYFTIPEPAPEPEPTESAAEPAPAEVAAVPAADAAIEPVVEAAPVEAVPGGEPVEAFVEAHADAPEAAAAAVAEEASPAAAPSASLPDLVELFDNPLYRDVIRSAVRDRAARLLEDVVNQVVSELEPLLQRHLSRQTRGAQ
jgi:hypothetical protein